MIYRGTGIYRVPNILTIVPLVIASGLRPKVTDREGLRRMVSASSSLMWSFAREKGLEHQFQHLLQRPKNRELAFRKPRYIAPKLALLWNIQDEVDNESEPAAFSLPPWIRRATGNTRAIYLNSRVDTMGS